MEKEILLLSDTIKELKSKAQRITPNYGPQAGGGGNGQRLENDVVSYVERERYLTELMDRQTDAIRNIFRLIYLVPPSRMRIILIERYINYRSFEQIASDINYTVRQVHRLHGQALAFIVQRCH